MTHAPPRKKPPVSELGRALAGRSLLSIADCSPDEIGLIVKDALRAKRAPVDRGALAGLRVAMLFEKPSLRTRASFEFGLGGLGAHAVYFDLASQRIGERESVKDHAKNLERWCDIVVARVHEHAVLEGLAAEATIPVINALSDREHPCQALADVLTLTEALGTLRGKRLAYIGDGNNVCVSLLLAAVSLGMVCTVVTPDGHGPPEVAVHAARSIADRAGGKLRLSHEPADVRRHHAVYTDTWRSMGHNTADVDAILGRFRPYTVNEALMAIASDGLEEESRFMHCLPAARGVEVAAGVIDGNRSLVYEQAENRMHAQNALVRRVVGR